MDIANLSTLIKGKILNSPLINAVENFKFNPDDIVSKDAFICYDNTQIDIAIKNGAYAVIFEGDVDIKNDEIAYICVSDLKFAIKRLIEYYSNFKKFYLLQKVKFEILKTLDHKSLKIISKNSNDFLIDLLNHEGDFISDEDLYNLKYIKIDDNKDFRLIRSSLFITDLIYKEKRYQLEFPQIFKDDLLYILDNFSYDFRVKNLNNFNHFRPIFVDRNFNIKGFGQSDRVIIVESDKDLFLKECEMLKINGIITASKIDSNLDTDIKFSNISQIKDIDKFRYIIYFGNFSDIYSSLKEAKNTTNLLFY